MTTHVPLMLRSLFAIAVLAASALAQRGDARMTGLVVDKATGAPVPKAEIILISDRRSVVSDSMGRYLFDDVPSGLVRFVVRAAGFPATSLSVALAHNESMARSIELDSSATGRSAAQRLPSVVTEGKATRGPRYADFEHHMATGRGQYLTREQIELNGYNSLQDAMRNLRGVNVDCGGGLGCFIRMARAPMQCKPDYVVDGMVNNSFGPATPIRDIEGIEVYTGPSEVPGEFAGRNAGCGVVVIWTKAGPSRKKP